MNILSFIKKLLFKDKHPDLKSHVFFYTLKYFNDIQVMSIKIDSKLKKALVKDYVSALYEVLHDPVLEFISSNDSHIEEVQSMFIDSITLLQTKMRDRGAPDMFIERIVEWQKMPIDNCVKMLQDVNSSQYHPGLYEKKIAYLATLNTFLHTTMITIEGTINSFNGDLEKALVGTIYDDEGDEG